MTPQPISQLFQTVLGIAAAVIIQHSRNQRPAPYPTQRIHPGGPVAAQEYTSSLLEHTTDVEFRDTFRLLKRKFRLLDKWIRRHGQASASRWVRLEQKMLVLLRSESTR